MATKFARNQAEKVQFELHESLLEHYFKRQAGSLWKAIVEGIMNSIDAHATRVTVTLNNASVLIEDDGKGFSDRSEVDNFFKVIGMPPQAGEVKTYGCFRMGRGQLFAYGKNEWRSGEFRLTVDIKKDSRSFNLETGLTPHAGCRIIVTFFDRLLPRGLNEALDEIERNVQFVAIPVIVNGKQVSVAPATVKWTLESENADIAVSATSSELVVYNQGVRVMSVPRYKHQVAGTVVSRKPLTLNFARNDIMHDCPVWAAITATLKKYVAQTKKDDGATKTSRRRRTSEINAERKAAALAIKSGIDVHMNKNAKIIALPGGAHTSVYRVIKQFAGNIFAHDHYSVSNLAYDQKVAVPITATTLGYFELPSVEALAAVLRERCNTTINVLSQGQIQQAVAGTSEYTVIPYEKCNSKERIILDVLNYAKDWLRHAIYHLNSHIVTSPELSRRLADRLGTRQIVIDNAVISFGDSVVKRQRNGAPARDAVGWVVPNPLTIVLNRSCVPHHLHRLSMFWKLGHDILRLLTYDLAGLPPNQSTYRLMVTMWETSSLFDFGFYGFSALPKFMRRVRQKTPRGIITDLERFEFGVEATHALLLIPDNETE